MNIERAIDCNPNITTDFKELAKECFSTIFQTLGEKHFFRWINVSGLSKDIKSLIIDWMSQSEIRETGKNNLGFIEYDANKIKIKKCKSVKDTTTHELYHFFTKHNKRFGCYINEGLTEYLKSLSLPNGEVTYEENVEFARLLHMLTGDSLIKAYLYRKDKNIDNLLRSLLNTGTYEVNKKERNELGKFYKILDERHYLLEKNKLSDEEEKKLEETKKYVQTMIIRMITAKITLMSENLEFYKNGKVDTDYAYSVIENYLELIPKNLLFTDFQMSFFSKKLLGIVSQNSISSEISGKEDVAIALFKMKFSGKQNMDIMDFIDTSLNIRRVSSINDGMLLSLISEYVIKVYGDNEKARTIEKIIKFNIEKHKNLYALKEERTKKTVESFMLKIDDDVYLEKRDNEFYYVKVDYNGKLTETLLGNTIGFDTRKLKGARIDLSKISGSEENSKIYIDVKMRRKEIMRNQVDRYHDFDVMSFEDFRRFETISPLIRSLVRQIQNHNFTRFLNDSSVPNGDTDMRGRDLYVGLFKQSMDFIDVFYNQSNQGSINADLIKSVIIEDTLDYLYNTYPIKREDGTYSRDKAIQEVYDTIRSEILSDETDYERIKAGTDILNRARKQILEDQKGTAFDYAKLCNSDDLYLQLCKLSKLLFESEYQNATKIISSINKTQAEKGEEDAKIEE